MIALALISAGLLFHLLAGAGMIRFRDPYNRLHASTMGTTLGTIFISSAVAAHGLANWGAGGAAMASHAFIVAVLIMLTGSVSSHVIARAAHREGISPGRVDEYGGVK